jgi:hypothetical protein
MALRQGALLVPRGRARPVWPPQPRARPELGRRFLRCVLQPVGIRRLSPIPSAPAGGKEYGAGVRIAQLAMRRTVLTMVAAVGLAVLGAWWNRQASLITHGCQIAEGTPSVPAFIGLVVMVGVAGLCRRLAPGLAPSREALLLAYFFMLFAAQIPSEAVVRHLFPRMTVPVYFAAPDNQVELVRDALPGWVLVKDEDVVRDFFEGREDGRVPWRAWLGPLLAWTVLIASFLTALLGLALFFHRPWAEGERLSYPLVELARGLVGEGQAAAGRSLLSHPLMWVGFAAAAVFNALNIAHAFNPAVTCPGQGYDLGALFTEPPWSGLRPLYMAWRPELVGLGYLVGTDVAFSAWASYLLLRVEGALAMALGYNVPGVPFDGHQGMGAFVALALMLGWSAWGGLLRASGREREVQESKAAVGLEGGQAKAAAASLAPEPRGASPGRQSRREQLETRLGALLLASGLIGTAAWGWAAGVALAPLAYYLAMVLAFALVYMRIRAQVGTPISYIFPRDPIRASVEVVGARWLAPGGRLEPLAALRALEYLSRSAVQSLGGTQMETLQVSRLTGAPVGAAVGVMAAGVAAGLLLGYYTHLTAYYTFGCNTLEGGTTEGGYRTLQARMDYQEILDWYQRSAGRDLVQFGFRVAGAVTAWACAAARTVWFRFPLHPLGFAMAATFGYHLWASFLLVWGVKTIILRLGGARLYRRLIPLFLGLAIGHFVVAGGVWGLVSAFSEHARRYVVWFT